MRRSWDFLKMHVSLFLYVAVFFVQVCYCPHDEKFISGSWFFCYDKEKRLCTNILTSIGNGSILDIDLKNGFAVRELIHAHDRKLYGVEYVITTLHPQKGTKQAACVDPAEPDKVLAAAQKENVTLSLCLCTHKHLDHSGGNEQLARKLPKIQIVGSAYEDTPGVNKKLHDGETVNLGNLRIEARHVPCHTAGHLFYFVTNSQKPKLTPILFSGDTLFVGGCGRFFEGSARQMHHALIEICGSFPKETRVYCGHEYTKANLEFALTVEPENEALKAKYEWVTQQRKEGKPTIPSSLEQEKEFNPFMRVEENSVQSAMEALGDSIETMRLLRERKNAN